MELNRLRWAARRGMLELDLILSPFVEHGYSDLSPEDQQKFERLLECEDQDLFNWFLNKATPESDEMKAIVNLVLNSVRSLA